MSLPWGFVISLGLTGVLMGLLSSLVGLRQKVEIPLWWTWYALWVVIVVIRDVPKPFLVILVASILAGILNGVTSSLLIETYRRNNPWYAKQMSVPNSQIQRRFLTMGPLIGAFFGSIVGGIAWALSRFL